MKHIKLFENFYKVDRKFLLDEIERKENLIWDSRDEKAKSDWNSISHDMLKYNDKFYDNLKNGEEIVTREWSDLSNDELDDALAKINIFINRDDIDVQDEY